MRQFLKQTLASTIGSFLGLSLFLTLGASGLVFLVFSAISTQDEPQVANKSILVFDLSMNIRDSEAPTNFSQAISGKTQETMTLRRVLQTIERATTDDRIVGLFLDGRKGGGSGGHANLAEVRTALEKFQAEGKKIIAYDVTLSESEYYLASLADEIILNPMGVMELNGLSSRQMFFKGALEKYGVEVQVVKAGNYKSAVEPYIRSDLSVENRQQTQALLTDLWNKFLSTVSDSRSLKVADLQQLVDTEGYVEPEQAVKTGLIDRMGYYDNVVSKLHELTGESAEKQEFRHINLSTYANRTAVEKTAISNNKIAIVYAEGAIVGGRGSIETIGSERFAEEFRELREDDSVKAIVLRVNSPGGSATASEVILREILLTRKEKPVVVSMGNMAASGGYWIAAGGSQIFAAENTITGSIGVFGLLSNIQEIANNNGVTWDVVKTGRFADINSNVRPKTEEELALYQKSVAKTYSIFLKKVAKYRNLPENQVEEIAQGRIWSGKEAVKIGLVDRIGGLEEAIAHAAKEAQLGDDWQIEEYPQQNLLETEIVKRLLNIEGLESSVKLDPITSEMFKIRKQLAFLATFDDPIGVYARLPFNFEIE